jgi:hypothetical protein
MSTALDGLMITRTMCPMIYGQEGKYDNKNNVSDDLWTRRKI